MKDEQKIVELNKKLEIAREALWQITIIAHEAGWDTDPGDIDDPVNVLENLSNILLSECRHIKKISESAFDELTV